jgi:hypothetical protein
VVTGAVLPYMVSQDCPSADLSSSGTNPQILSIASTETTEILSTPAYPLLPSSSSGSSDNDDGHRMSEAKDIFSPSRTSQTSTSSETLNNIPMQPLPVEARSHSDAEPAVPVVYASNNISRLGPIGSCGSLWEISEHIWPMMPAEIPRYKNNRIMSGMRTVS